MRIRYVIQRLDGYTDGKPSWCKERPSYFTREAAESRLAQMKKAFPNKTCRIRQIKLKEGADG